MNNLLSLAQQDVTLRRSAATNGGEWAGPCPGCGGWDRFRLWPTKGRYWCRGCGKKGDEIQYLRDFRSMSFREAAQCVGKDLAPDPRRAQRQQRLRELKAEYDRWQRETWRTKIARLDELRTDIATAELAYRAITRSPGFCAEEEESYWVGRLGLLYDEREILDNDLDILHYRTNEAERIKWWKECR